MNLYRRRSFQASLLLLLAGMVALSAAVVAQRRKSHKLRATALLELTTDSSGKSKAQLIPIAILDEGSFHDAGLYKAAPRPFALQPGVVYEAQQTGTVLGYVTVSSAFKQGIWIGQGEWQPVRPAEAKATPAPAPSADERPVLRRPGSAPAATPVPSPTPAVTPSPSPAETGAAPAPDERPTLHRSTGSPTATPTPAQAAPTPPPDTDRPVLKRPGSTPGSTDDKAAATTTQPAPTKAATAVPVLGPGTHVLVAVSDEQSLDMRSYEFSWKPGEKAAVDVKMRRLALAQLPRETPPLTDSSLKNVSIRGFDLDLSNDAVVVLTAEAAAKPPAGGKPVTRYITVIARMDFEGNPQRLAASIADSSRLDVAPRLELIDAADVDGDGAAELVFRQFDYDQKSYVIYSVGRGSVSKVFEGASSPLK